MKTGFRKEVFDLCKKLQNNVEAKKIGSLIHDMSVSVEDKNTGAIKNNLHGDFAYVAKNNNSQFHGFLFVDDHINDLKLPVPLRVENLSLDERELIEKGHMTIVRFIDLCLIDIKKESEVVGKALDPYLLFKEVKCDQTITPILTDEELSATSNAFKSGKVYKYLVESKFATIFNKIDLSQMRQLVQVTEKEIAKSFNNDTTSDLRDFSMRIVRNYENEADVVFALSLLIIALRDSLKMACQLLYESICGGNLIVLNNDNIINIENQISSVICKKYKVLIQGINFNYTGSSIGSILLMDCDPSDDRHIHEFGMITAMTCSFASDMGQTTKFSFVTVDDELINIFNLTDNIVKIDMPEIIIQKHM